ncbi:secondary metabolite protein [Streptacidiphilus sp. ASG 303]|uniref:secondary metabolite protein n=1 Tax=Streptacidiphilus sp. ASG 303 TaxID=2896847 RepID=UPI001E2A574D|nr:secondary metabolite protein [Streptacidiphilus sp. ASG 303]MCD0485220.1 secondary metabolite protein [Streptacidiphilus sp. ASG 303]
MDFPKPFDIDVFLQRLSAHRGRPLHVHELPDLGGAGAPCGLWLAFDHEDHLFHPRGLSRRHRAQVLKHEATHILLGHRTSMDIKAFVDLLPDGIDPVAAEQAFGRTSYETDQERDAELAASFLDELIEELSADPYAAGQDDVLARLDDALGHPVKDRRS